MGIHYDEICLVCFGIAKHSLDLNGFGIDKSIVITVSEKLVDLGFFFLRFRNAPISSKNTNQGIVIVFTISRFFLVTDLVRFFEAFNSKINISVCFVLVRLLTQVVVNITRDIHSAAIWVLG